MCSFIYARARARMCVCVYGCMYVCMYETYRIDVLGVESRYLEYMKAIVFKNVEIRLLINVYAIVWPSILPYSDDNL